MKPQRRKAIQHRVDKLLEEQGISSDPVNVEKIAKSMGAQLRFSPLDEELSGMVYIKEDIPIIGVNALHHPNRQRFTIAHEIGHLILHTDAIKKAIHVDKDFPMLMRDSLSSAGVEEMEVEANLFAAELLMPRSLLAASLEHQVFDIDDDQKVVSLAKQYKVSASAMRYRLGNLLT